MPNQIIPVLWGNPLRKSEVNTLDKVNELVDFINNSDIHELDLIASDQGREVVTGTSTQLAQLEVYGESVQDGTPTPENPVPVQVVGGRNLLDGCDGEATGNYPFNHDYNINPLQFPRMLYAGESVVFSFDVINNITTNVGIILIYSDNTTASFYTPTNGIPGRKSNTITLPKNTIACGFYNVSADLIVANYQLEVGANATPYIPYNCIGMKIDESDTPIDLQGHVLASLPDGTQDVLHVNSAWRVWIEQHVKPIDLADQTWSYQTTWESWYTPYFSDMVPVDRGAAQMNNILCDTLLYITTNQGITAGQPNGITFTVTSAIGSRLLARNGSTTITPTGKAYYELATPQTIELGTIDPPAIPSGSVVEIVATLQPEFALAWFTENGLPLAINDMRDYVDAKINEVNARIDELHGIARANLEVQSIPVDDTENENDTEVTENER